MPTADRYPGLRIHICARWLGFVSALAFLISRLGDQLHGAHVFRQAHIVSNIDKMREQGLFTIPGTYNQGMPDLMYDFPVFQAIAVVLARTLGLESYVSARLLGLLVFVASFSVLHRLLHLVESRPAVRELTLLLFCLAPIQLFYCSAPVPDSLACMLALLAVLAHERMIAGTGSKMWFLLAVFCAFTATLIKIPVFLPAATVIAWRGIAVGGVRVLWRRDYLCMAAGVFTAIAVYVTVSNTVNAEWQAEHVLTQFGSRTYWYFSNLADRSSWDHYAKILSYLAKYLLNPLTFALCLLALPVWRASAGSAGPFVPWLLGSVFAIVLFFNLHWRHNYYQLPYVVPFCYLAALGAYRIHHLIQPRRAPGIILAVVLLSVSVFFSVKYVLRLEHSSAAYVERLQAAGVMLQKITTADDFIIYLVPRFDYQPEQLYFAQRDGFTADAYSFDVTMLNLIRARNRPRGRLLVFCPSDARAALGARLGDLDLIEINRDENGTVFHWRR